MYLSKVGLMKRLDESSFFEFTPTCNIVRLSVIMLTITPVILFVLFYEVSVIFEIIYVIIAGR